MSVLEFTHFDTVLGPVLIAATSEGICRLRLPCASPDEELSAAAARHGCAELEHDTKQVLAARELLLRHLDGERVEWSCRLDLRGTPFQMSVWRAVQQIPYGETRSYAYLARTLGRAAAVRAVGAANGANPVQVIIPCHRVLGASGALTGYAGGVAVKRALLDLEQAHLPL